VNLFLILILAAVVGGGLVALTVFVLAAMGRRRDRDRRE